MTWEMLQSNQTRKYTRTGVTQTVNLPPESHPYRNPQLEVTVAPLSGQTPGLVPSFSNPVKTLFPRSPWPLQKGQDSTYFCVTVCSWNKCPGEQTAYSLLQRPEKVMVRLLMHPLVPEAFGSQL